MPDPSRPASGATTPECSLREHDYCRPGPVITSYGDMVMDVKCSCACHPRRRDGQFASSTLPRSVQARQTGSPA